MPYTPPQLEKVHGLLVLGSAIPQSEWCGVSAWVGWGRECSLSAAAGHAFKLNREMLVWWATGMTQ